MIRRRLRRWLGMALAMTTFGGAAPAAAQDSPPRRLNVLLILVDDLKPAIHAYGDPVAITPNIDRLIARGTRFDLAYANQAVCAPSRFNLLTGARSTSSGIYDFGINLRDVMPQAVTLPQYFMRAGYHAESIGKVFHTGHGTVGDPQSWSVPPHKDHVIEYVSAEAQAIGRTREEALFGDFELPDGDVWDIAAALPRGLAWERPDVPDDAYADGRSARHAATRLAALGQSDRPFFLAVGFARPHLPFSVPARYWDLYDPAALPMPMLDHLPEGAPALAGKTGGEIAAYTPVPPNTSEADFPDALKRQLIHGYYAGVSYVDAQIGVVLDALASAGLAEDTIVVLWGDHGYHLGDHALWTKHTNFEQATRIPVVFAGPQVSAGAATGHLAETVDIYPTLAALAGLPAPAGPQPIDGINLVPVLRQPGTRLRGYAYHTYPRPHHWGQAIRTERYRLVRWTDDRTGERIHELYDLVGDPQETRNMASSEPAIVRQLDGIIDRHPAPAPLPVRE
ncbi:iduronate-2-sulfatase [Croceibacterium mercuriale]|uniref:Iduronate-2-sulfatase n=1 Tax=Croceibacterium mercuriale TaxID=1572751 RepID=A0A0B2BYN3_9SPHN|nr:sulfatase [Croceibacterium mercuriale]KHL26569.1 iduronate-2-sulfatase [Croceibacterium mercuriale]